MLLGEICSNDPHFYHACDEKFGADIKNSEILCSYYWCEWNDSAYLSPTISIIGDICNGEFDCLNTKLDESGCSGDMVTLPSGKKIQSNLRCNDKCDEYEYCEDEAICNGYTYIGMYCEKVGSESGSIGLVTPGRICNGKNNCKNGKDEEDCEVTNSTEQTCEKIYGGIVPLHNYTRCQITDVAEITDFYRYCKNEGSEQTNCSDPTRIGVHCDVGGYPSTVSKYMICKNKQQICDDNFENDCRTLSKTCTIHKHFMCDGKDDCTDRADETHPTCSSMMTTSCARRGGRVSSSYFIPRSWLLDGVQDCLDGTDEGLKNWKKCGSGKTTRLMDLDKECKTTFICLWGNPGYVEVHNLCDGIETCGNENEICSRSRSSSEVQNFVASSNVGRSKKLSYCLRGLEDIERLANQSCYTTEFFFPAHEYFGVDPTILVTLPKAKRNCDHMFGEQYVYTSCNNKCVDSSCPLKNIPRHEVCPGQFPNRVGTLANNKYLAFFTRSQGDVLKNNYFVCNNKYKCIDYSKVCNLVDDCGDGSDEEECTNHFKCATTGKYIPRTKKCDGVLDCFDSSDECNETCSREILEGQSLKIISWIIGSLAVIANLIVIFSNIITIKRCKTSVALVNKSLVTMIALGDCLVGCYLFTISTYDGIVFQKEYCKQQIEWLATTQCSTIGILSSVGSQISLFSMTGLSIIRLFGVCGNKMTVPGEVTVTKSALTLAAIIGITLVSVAIAMIPVVESFENFFVNGLKFPDELALFIGAVGKKEILNILEAYYGKMKEASLSWKTINEMVGRMYSHDGQKDLMKSVERVGFYGNDGVCLFKYFVKQDDPQRNFTWSILILNFICFIFILCSYCLIGFLARRSSQSLQKAANQKDILQRNRRMNRKIGIIITTDFLCWVPFIIVCILHSLQVLDATPWYSLVSMIILPINSVINPFLYDGSKFKLVISQMRRLKNLFVSHLTHQTEISQVGMQENIVMNPTSKDLNDIEESKHHETVT